MESSCSNGKGGCTCLSQSGAYLGSSKSRSQTLSWSACFWTKSWSIVIADAVSSSSEFLRSASDLSCWSSCLRSRSDKELTWYFRDIQYSCIAFGDLHNIAPNAYMSAKLCSVLSANASIRARSFESSRFKRRPNLLFDEYAPIQATTTHHYLSGRYSKYSWNFSASRSANWSLSSSSDMGRSHNRHANK